MLEMCKRGEEMECHFYSTVDIVHATLSFRRQNFRFNNSSSIMIQWKISRAGINSQTNTLGSEKFLLLQIKLCGLKICRERVKNCSVTAFYHQHWDHNIKLQLLKQFKYKNTIGMQHCQINCLQCSHFLHCLHCLDLNDGQIWTIITSNIQHITLNLPL